MEDGQRLAILESAVQTVELNNPYTISVFTPVTDGDWQRLNDLMLSALGHDIDRYSAALLGAGWDRCVAMIREFARDAAEAADGR